MKPSEYLGPLRNKNARNSLKQKKQVVRELFMWPDEPLPTSGLVSDASCFGFQSNLKNDGYFHGKCEWRVMDLCTREFVVVSPVYPQGTINQSEFLGVVAALNYLHERGDTRTTVYGDNKLANAWVRSRRASSNLPLNEFTYEICDAVKEAELWLRQNKPTNPIVYWNKYIWGENPSDYDRKGYQYTAPTA
jgi:ribonuclease HI